MGPLFFMGNQNQNIVFRMNKMKSTIFFFVTRAAAALGEQVLVFVSVVHRTSSISQPYGPECKQ